MAATKKLAPHLSGDPGRLLRSPGQKKIPPLETGGEGEFCCSDEKSSALWNGHVLRLFSIQKYSIPQMPSIAIISSPLLTGGEDSIIAAITHATTNKIKAFVAPLIRPTRVIESDKNLQFSFFYLRQKPFSIQRRPSRRTWHFWNQVVFIDCDFRNSFLAVLA